MPYTLNNGVRIYWEEHGSGPPMLLVMGLSFTLDMWFRVVPTLSRTRRVILFDNRGVGRSDVPRGPYSMAAMASDAMAVLDAAGVHERVTLMGASMGGMIVQELALRAEDRFRALLLGCTACGPFYRAHWPNFQRAPGFLQYVRLRGEARQRSLIRLLYADTTPPERINEDLAVLVPRQAPLTSVLYQLTGIMRWSSWARLPRVHLPTLVVHGDQDHILPPGNGSMIAGRIPGAELVIIPQAGHMITTDQPERSLELMDRFLWQLSGEETVRVRFRHPPEAPAR
jgi:3-oxoadipate enol-lactonase